MREIATQAYIQVSSEYFGNPSGSHFASRAAKGILEDSREGFASLLGVKAPEIIFTSGGTESANLAILGPVLSQGSIILASKLEHHGVLEPLKKREGVRWINVTSTGVIDLDHLEHLLSEVGDSVSLLALMAVNNETGVIQPIREASELVRKYAPKGKIFCDGVQGGAWLNLQPLMECVDLLGLSAHKFGGPKGVGVLAKKSSVNFVPLITGGGQEFEFRSGTQNVAGISAAYAAYQECYKDLESDNNRAVRNQEVFLEFLSRDCGEVSISGLESSRVPGILNLQFPGISNEEILYLCDEREVYISGGASCASGALEPSHVLMAMGLDENSARSAVRVSFGYRTNAEDLMMAASVISQVVRDLGYKDRR